MYLKLVFQLENEPDHVIIADLLWVELIAVQVEREFSLLAVVRARAVAFLDGVLLEQEKKKQKLIALHQS